MRGQVTVPIDVDEVIEACAVFHRWRGHELELPLHVRRRVAAVNANADVRAIQEGGSVALVLSPDLRALVADLRAREAPPGAGFVRT